MTKRGKRILAALLVLLLAGGVLAAAKLWLGRFTPERWRAASRNERQELVPSLLRSVDFVGMTREEITALLGPETSEDPAAGPYPSTWRTPYNLVYDFGEKHRAMGKNTALLFFFREDGRCEGYYWLEYSW